MYEKIRKERRRKERIPGIKEGKDEGRKSIQKCTQCYVIKKM